MIFVGDTAIPYKNAVTLDMPEWLKHKNWFGNLEGAVISNSSNLHKKSIVFNDKDALRSLLNELNITGMALANNHIFDTGSFNETLSFLKEVEIPYCGIGKNSFEASQPLVLGENGIPIVIYNFGWDVIQCEAATKDKMGVNSLTASHVLNSLNNAKHIYPDSKIIFFFHWSYELEEHPQPWERELAKALIDNGADGIIGSHPHRIGGIEIYKERPIIYSLGNWMFKQNYYMNSRLQFPDFSNKELAFEWDLNTSEMLFHFFEYDRNKSNLTFISTETVNSKKIGNYKPFSGLTNEEYKRFYRLNHYHKRKMLPIYYWEDSKFMILLKNKANKIRDFVIKVIKHNTKQKYKRV
ncbi:hypothetical protein AGMMS49928_28530 [Spirochaetia bacterium]|nr:hypothetical protein AGMMS49928_28530 [Spirochaetia bacterium]